MWTGPNRTQTDDMTWFSVDVEANGPAPGLYSMTSLGAVAVRGQLEDQFYVELEPLPNAGVNREALAVAGLSMEHLVEHGLEAAIAMQQLADWVKATAENSAVLVSDNPGFDAAFITYYFALAEIPNPFGFSSRRIGDLFAGFKKDSRKANEWKKLRTDAHTHNALDDALGNAGALLRIAEMGLRIPHT